MTRFLSAGGAARVVCLILFVLSLPWAAAAPIQPTGIMVSVLPGSNDPSNPYTEDLNIKA